jgi:Tfp pilus assembly protein PilF
MHKSIVLSALIASAVVLSACSDASKKDSDEDKTIVGVVDETNLNEIMLTVADPNQAVNYFRDALTKDPSRADLKRNLAVSLVRAKRAQEAAAIYEQLDASGDLTSQDRVDYAEAMIRANDWKGAKAQLNQTPPTLETFQRYRLEAIVADSEKKWKKADSFYETAVGLTTKPANVLNNWGYSKLTRTDYKGAETLFVKAITADPKLYTAKNNLVLSRASRKEYNLPVIPMTQIERAELMYTAALAAVKNGDKQTGRGLLEKAIETHPRHFEAAVRSLKGLTG